jgi:predicted  nucleic acid-binding Zn-ribbon protein
MARSSDIQNDINHLQSQWDGENHAAQNLQTQIRGMQNQLNQHQHRMDDFQSQMRNKQNELKIARDTEAKEERERAALTQTRMAA